MSWMDSWSRPNKSQATPPPYYLTHGDSVPYCHSCGRVIGARRSNTSKASSTEVKYCSDKCKRHRPSTVPTSLDVRIGEALAALLEGQPPPETTIKPATEAQTEAAPATTLQKLKQRPKKGDPRIIISLSELETAVFGDRKDPNKTHGRRRNRAPRAMAEPAEWKSVDMEDDHAPVSAQSNQQEAITDEGTADSFSDSDDNPDDEVSAGGVSIKDHHQHIRRPPQTQSDVNFSVGGERGWAERISETPEMLAKRREGQKRAEEKGQIKSGARRAVAFGLLVDAPPPASGGKRTKKAAAQEGPEREVKVQRKCEALMNGQVVDPSFAKGDWSIRWRED